MKKPTPAQKPIDTEVGPTLRAALDCLDICTELLDLIPKTATSARKELISRMAALNQIAITGIKTEKIE